MKKTHDDALSQLLTAKDVSELLGIHVRTLRRLVAQAESGDGDFPTPLRISERTIRWRSEDLEDYLERISKER